MELSRREFVNFVRLSSCDDVSDRVFNVITSHLQSMVTDFMQRFVDLSEMDFPKWLTQYKLVDHGDVEQQFQNELADLQNDSSAEVVHKAKRQFMWLDEEIVENYPNLSKHAQSLLLPFPTSYLVECAFSAVADILTKKRGSLTVIDRCDLRLKLTKLVPSVKNLVDQNDSSSPRLALIIMSFAFSNNLLQTKITPIYAVKKRTFVVKIQYLSFVIVYILCPSFNFL